MIFELTVKDDKGAKGTSEVTVMDKLNTLNNIDITGILSNKPQSQPQTCPDGSQPDPNGNCPVPIENTPE